MIRSNSLRKKMLVSGPIQGRLMLRIGLYWVLYHVVLWHAMFVYRYLHYRGSGAAILGAIPFRELYGRFVIDHYPVILCAVITLPIVLMDMLHLTHRIAGPLVRFQNALCDLAAGKEVQQISLRKGDLLTEFQAEFNKYLAELSARRRSTDAGTRDVAMTDADTEIVARVVDLQTSLQPARTIPDDDLSPAVPADVPSPVLEASLR